MKRIITLMFLSLLLFSCSSTGYVSSEGEVLLPYLDTDLLYQLTEYPDDTIWIIDVRPSAAFALGHIPTARSFPSSEIGERLDELPPSQYLILYCETGGRAQAVIKKLEAAGYTRMMNWGGYTRWDRELVTD